MSKHEALEVVYEGVERSPESERAESVAWNVSELPTAGVTTGRVASEATERPSKRQKRTESQVLADLKGDLLGEATYLKERVTKLEEKIAELFAGVSPEAATLVLRSPALAHLSRYLP